MSNQHHLAQDSTLVTSPPASSVELYRSKVASQTSYWNSFLHWWTSSFGRATPFYRFLAEERLLNLTLDLALNVQNHANQHSVLAAEEIPTSKPRGVIELVPINDGKDWINTLRLLSPSPSRADQNLRDLLDASNSTQQLLHKQEYAIPFDFYAKDESKKNLVIAHGFGAGLGFFYRNYPQLSRLPNYNVFAIDWLGMGNSSRPSFPRKSSNEQANIKQADEFFTSSLEAWRIRMKIDKMTLVGHSLGGYLSVKYALEYPDRVEKLILVSPAGIPKQQPIPVERLDPEFKPSWFFRLAQRLWSWEVSPQTILRSLGPFGQIITNRYATRRFELGSPTIEEKSALAEYIYQISAGKGSGEYSAPRLLYPFFTGIIQENGAKSRTGKFFCGIYAKTPLADALSKLCMPTTFLYGSTDWMDFKHALNVAPSLRVPVKVAVVDKAGHHLYLDNPEGFNHALMVELQQVSENVERDDVTYRIF